ncbi:uncharacterized protein LOC110729942 [Chenopodium quinoa]|uniref:uncharacterized protein LOC110729940 n=1 Tax=Chenopodium quinoa TaxID=63459 RepID=UPI000B78B416|nr:uncharacterized protein LOC110729940 [Chenopodium quinoa]XP_021765426.1 uncharacterized protein LOC110729942 [Chenopodium quinoa]
MKTNLNSTLKPPKARTPPSKPPSTDGSPEPVPIAVVHPSAPPKRKAITTKGGDRKRRNSQNFPSWNYTHGYHINYDWCTSKQSLLRLSLKLESGTISFLSRGREEKNRGKGKTQVIEGDTSASEEEGSESEEEESKENSEGDKEEEEISEGEAQEAEPEKGEETQSEREPSSETESLEFPFVPVFKGELRRSKRKIVKPTVSTPKPVIIEDISSSDHSDPDFTPTQVPFASEPSSIHNSPPTQDDPSSIHVSPPKKTSPSPAFPPSQPTGFAAFSGTNVSVFLSSTGESIDGEADYNGQQQAGGHGQANDLSSRPATSSGRISGHRLCRGGGEACKG